MKKNVQSVLLKKSNDRGAPYSFVPTGIFSNIEKHHITTIVQLKHFVTCAIISKAINQNHNSLFIFKSPN